MVDKIIVTNYAALQKKYGGAALNPILAAVKGLIAADKVRGLVTRIVDISDAAQMKQYKGKAVTSQKSERQVKDAVDAIYKATTPDYLVILDGPDVVPHVTLDNPVPKDGDKNVPSDLPYASDAPFSRDPTKFAAVTRVVGRIAGLTGAKAPDFLIKQVDAAAKYKSLRHADYLSHFAISAQVWEKSTEESVENIFGTRKIEICPPTGSPSVSKLLSPLSHFINCHGAEVDPQFYGQRGTAYPVSMTSADVTKGAKRNTMVAAECCYGAQLFDPAFAAGQWPISNSYLGAGAVAFVGSSTIAYGPSEGNGSADLLAQFFLIDALGGASFGRAFLQARQKFVLGQKMEDPVNVKTLAQFILLADPSLQPCRAEGAHAEEIAQGIDGAAARATRRVYLKAAGQGARDASGFPGKKAARTPKKLHNLVTKIARDRGFRMKPQDIDYFDVVGGEDYGKAMKARGMEQKVAILTRHERIPKPLPEDKRKWSKVRVLVAHTQDNRVIEIAEYFSR
jgi:peptidase C25-like protein